MINRERFRQGLLHAKKRTRRFKYSWRGGDLEPESEYKERLAKLRKTTKLCNCSCCGGRRYWEGDTRKEKLNKYYFEHWDKEEFDENEEPFWYEYDYNDYYEGINDLDDVGEDE